MCISRSSIIRSSIEPDFLSVFVQNFPTPNIGGGVGNHKECVAQLAQGSDWSIRHR